ncbi:MAG: MurR/RpiR family transcriptional regulator [Rhizobiaceae bacterium]|nr:MurR/RpiR family transcriptional regulator [Rhizobiaceae bacterium]
MNKALDIVAELYRLAEDGSKLDRHLAKLVLADPEFFIHEAIAKIAERAQVSEPTVTRFCRSLGLDGTREFKVKLAQALAVGARFLQVADPDRGTTNRRVPDTIAASAHGAIDAVCKGIDVGKLSNAADAIIAARLIRVYGSGGSSSMAAVELETRLFRFGLPVVASVDGEIQRMTASVADPKTVIVAFSISGQLQSIIDALSIARHYGATTIAVTAPESEIAAAAEMVFPFHIDEGENVYRPSPARYGILAFVDILSMIIAEKLGPQVVESMRRIKHQLNVMEHRDPQFPLGD